VENEIAGADWRDMVRTGLDDTEGGETFAAWATDDDRDTEAKIPVTLSGGMWRLRKANGDLVTGQCRDQHTRASIKLKTGDATTRWMGFSLIARDRRDVRPDILALVWQRHTQALPKLIEYGRNYLIASGHKMQPNVLEAAAADALVIMMYGKRRGLRTHGPTLRMRDAQFRLRHGTLGPLRDVALRAYLRRYKEAVERFARVFDWVPTRYNTAHGSGFAADSLWHPERSTGRRSPGLLISGFGHNENGKVSPVHKLAIAAGRERIAA
jgi:hypothetical protein